MICKTYDFARHTIQDPIHGAITFGTLEKAIIDHPLFQRLHSLRQNSLLFLVFPSANHTRFDHSIGVMALASKYFDAILSNQEKICAAGSRRKGFQEPYRVDSNEVRDVVQTLSQDCYFRIVVRVAALFHDIGHGPLSHLFDNFFPSSKQLIKFLKEPLYTHIKARLQSTPKSKIHKPVRHETLSCVIATRVLLDCATQIKENAVDPGKMVRDICAVIDERIPPSDYFTRFPFRANDLLHDIISGDLDADRMDYLLRDSHMCGVNYGLYDPDRILKSMCAYVDSKRRSLRVAMRYSGLGAFEDLILSRYQMHAQIYGHKTNRSCNAMLQRIRERLQNTSWSWHKGCKTMSAFLDTFCSLDDHTFINLLRDKKIDRGAGKIKEIAEFLFLKRKLYKRVYEERAPFSENDTEADSAVRRRWQRYKHQLKARRIPFAEDVFENKGVKVSSMNYPLKVLRKDPREGYYLVHEVRELSTVVRYIPEMERIYRVYCKNAYIKNAKQFV